MRRQSWVPSYSESVNTKWATYVNTTALAEELATVAILIAPMRPVILTVNSSISLLLSYMKHIWLVLFCLFVCFHFYGTGDRPSSSFMLGKRSALSCTPNPRNPSGLKWLCQPAKNGENLQELSEVTVRVHHRQRGGGTLRNREHKCQTLLVLFFRTLPWCLIESPWKQQKSPP